MPTSANRTARVLILTRRPLLAALLGMLIELESFEPVFAEPHENAEDALARVKPLLVILLDGELEAAQSDLFLARASRRGVRVVLFKPPGSRVDVGAIAEARSLAWISLPVDRQALATLIGDQAPGTRSAGDRRTVARGDAPPDALIYLDRNGRRWFVYDRRSGPRRATDREASVFRAEEDYRVFINDRGEEWRLPIPADAPLALTDEALERQLAQAIRVEPAS